MKRSLKLKDIEARERLVKTDIDVLRKLESMLLKDYPLTVEREQLRNIIRNKEK